MVHCPSHDWDRYCDEQDQAAAESVAWWKEHQDRVLAVICASLASDRPGRLEEMDDLDITNLVKAAAKVVEAVACQSEPL